MKRPAWILISALIIVLSACKNESSINENDASEVIAEHLIAKPEYNTVIFHFGELRFRGRKDQEVIKKYKELEATGLIEMVLDDQKKVFLSKDSSYIYKVRLTEKAAPLVIDQGKDRATVKAINYILDDAKPVNFVRVNNKTAKATVSLKKVETEFFPFMNSKDSNSEFITKTYKLKLKKDKGWQVD